MDKIKFEKFKQDYALKTLVQETQFEQWLKLFFYLEYELNKKYDTIYQDAFYIKLYELLTEGMDYAKKVHNNLSTEINSEKINWYNTLIQGLLEIRLSFSDVEFEFIEYKRHSASHIFQNKYEVGIKSNGNFKTNYKTGESLDEINKRFIEIILKHGDDKKFDLYITGKLHPLISELYTSLTQKS